MIYKIIERFNIDKYLSNQLMMIADLFAVLFSSICSIAFVSIVARNSYSLQYISLWVGASFVFAFLIFFLLKTNRDIEKESALNIVGTSILAVLLKQISLGFSIATIHLHAGFSFPHLFALLIVDGLACLTLLIIVKGLFIVCVDVMRQRAQRRRSTPVVFVYGTSVNAKEYAELQQGAQGYVVAGLIHPGNRNRHKNLRENSIFEYKNYDFLDAIIDKYEVCSVIFVNEEDLRREEEKLVLHCNNKKVKVMYRPPMEEIGSRHSSTRSQVREIRIEDLLGRSEIKISIDKIKQEFQNKVIVVTGAAGSIGSQLCRQLATYGISKLVLFDDAETPMHNIRLELEESFPELEIYPIIGDVRSNKRLDSVFRLYHPNVVFHAAAYKHVPLMEENPTEAVLANVCGSRNVANKCLEYDVEKMVMISTDKAVNPTNVMGCTKRLAEIYVQSLGLAIQNGQVEGKTKFVTTRFGNVLGSNGSVIPRFREQIAKGGPLTVTHPEITRFFMTIPEACRLVLEAATMTSGNEIFVFDMGQSVKIADMARKMIELAGFVPDKDIKIEYTGLRPGEKLYEEVLATDENTIPTAHGSIRIAKVREYDYAEAKNAMNQLEELAKELNVDETVMLMKRIVPEFKSKNSVFERFDK